MSDPAMRSRGLIDPRQPELASEPAIVLATLVSATGSSSKRVGTKMIVGQSGRLIGGVTIGGCVDAQVIEAADALMDSGDRRTLSISLDDDEAWEIGLTCGGTIAVQLERLEPARAADAVLTAHAVAAAALERGEAVVIVSSIDGPATASVIDETGACRGSLGSAAIDSAAIGVATDVLRSGSRMESIAGGSYFFDRQAPPTTLVIVGAGEIAIALARFARELDMRTIVIDGRDRYATRERFPFADELLVGMPSEIIATLAPTKRTALILVVHDYKYELPILRRWLRQPLGYLGMLGSRKRGAAMRDILREEGFTDEELARVHTPIGLDLGGKSSPEVALSIIAEVVAVRSGKRA